MALHKHFREYTAGEIARIKEETCVKHKCPYLGRLFTCNAYNHKDSSMSNKTCNYCLYTGKVRGCMPDECTHYKDNVNQLKELKKKTELRYKRLEKANRKRKGDLKL